MPHHLQCEGIVKEININNMYNIELLLCSSRKYPYSPEGTGNSWGVGGSQRPKKLSKCMKLDWNFQRGGGGGAQGKIPSVGEVWIIFGTTHLRILQHL